MPGLDEHPLHLMHGDLKPGNIQVTPTGEVKLLDFGIAKAEFDHREAKTTNSIAGTVGYMAPERFVGLDHERSDVYSMGVVLHQLITGEKPKTTDWKAINDNLTYESTRWLERLVVTFSDRAHPGEQHFPDLVVDFDASSIRGVASAVP